MVSTSMADGDAYERAHLENAKAGKATEPAANRHDWRRTLRRLERLSRRVPFDQRALRVRVRRQQDAYEARAILVLPADTLVGHGGSPDPDRALADAVDWLALELRRRNEVARREALDLRRRTRQRDVGAATEHLDLDHARGEDSAFIDLARPLLRWVRDHAHRELVASQLGGQIDAGAVTVSDVLDAVLVRAWSRFASHPPDRGLDEWLVALVHDVVDEYSSEYSSEPGARPPTGPGGRTAPRESTPARYEAGAGWLAEGEPYWGAPAPLAVDDLLPGAEPSEILLGLGAAAEDRVLLDLLSDMSRAQRRAFTLSVLEGYTDYEIARLQGRTEAEVRADIGNVSDRLRDRVTDAP